MRILEIKNNLVKISYTSQDNLVLSGFVIIEDSQYPYVAQVMSLKADNGINYAIVKLLFTFDSEGVVKNYNGTIPELEANITKLSSEELLDILPIETPFAIGKLAQQNFILNVDYSILENNLLICSDNLENTDVLLSNIAKRITVNNDKSILFDTTGTVDAENTLVFGKDFKLPLNSNTINYIYEHDLNDISASSKAVIQDILIEVQEYSETLIDKFIPFDMFLNVISTQAKATQMPELSILKSRLIKYGKENIFAQDAKEIHSLRSSVRANLSTVLDISKASSSIQNLIYSTVYDELESLDLFVYSIVMINNENCNKRLLKRFLSTDKIYTTITCSHNYRYIHDLKEFSSNMILFEPQTVQHDFGAYNILLNKLNPDEAIIYGKATQNIPLIIEVMPIEALYDYDNAVAAENNSKTETDNKDSFEDDTYSQESMMVDNSDFPSSGAIEQVAAQVLGTVTEDEVYDGSNNDDNTVVQDMSEKVADNFSDLPEVEQTSSINVTEEEFADKEDDKEPNIISEENNDEDYIDEDDNYTDNADEPEEPLTTIDESAELSLNEENLDKTEIVEDTDDNKADIINEQTLPEVNLINDIDEFKEINKNEETDLIIEQNIDEGNSSSSNSLESAEMDSYSKKIAPEFNELVDIENNTLINEGIVTEEISEDNPKIIDEDINIKNSEDENLVEAETTELPLIEEEDGSNVDEDDSVDSISRDAEIKENIDENALSEEDLNLIDNVNISNDIDEFKNNSVIEEQEESIDTNEAVSEDDIEDNFEEQDDLNNDEYIVREFNDDPENLNDNSEDNEKVSDDNLYINEEPTPPVVPVYSADEDTPVTGEIQLFEAGDKVLHPKYGEGIVEKMVKFGNKVLCSISFSNGRRLLDPTISQLTKI